MSTDDAENCLAQPTRFDISWTCSLPDWIYTYLRSFYNDSSRPLGTNNTIYENVGMPNVLYELQGDVSRECDDGGEHCELHSAGNGLLSETEFDTAIADLTISLLCRRACSRAPTKYRFLGLGILGIPYILVFLMSKEFSKDYH